MLFLWLILLLLMINVVFGQTTYLFGMTERDASPTQQMIDQRDVWLGGYGVWKGRGAPEGIHDPIMIYTWIISDNNVTLGFMVADVIGLSNIQNNRIKEGVNAAIGLSVDNIFLSSTHTHSGVDMQGLWGGTSQEYKDMFVEIAIESFVDAFNKRRSAELYASKGNGTEWARNRRGHGWTNDEMTIMTAIDAVNGERLGTVINFAVHPVVLDTDNLFFSADFAYYFRLYVKEGQGGNASVAYVNGAEGDVNPRSGEICCYDTFECCDRCGGGMASTALEILNDNFERLTGPIFAFTHYYNHPVMNPAFVLAYEIGWLDYTFPYNDTGSPKYSYDTLVSYWSIGQLETINLPGESLSYNSYPVLQAMTKTFKQIFGLTGDSIGYLVPTDEWDPANGYEEKVCIERTFGDVSRDIALDLVNEFSQS